MELRHLRYFLAVAEESNIRRAADRLHVSQPALSKQIKDLEHELGVALLIRSSTGVELTAAGQIYLDEVHEILARVQRAGSLAREAAEGRRGKLTIGNVGPMSSSFMPGTLALFRERCPEVEVALVELGPFQQLEALQAGTIQVGFAGGDVDSFPDQVEHLTVLKSPISVVMSRRHRLARMAKVSLAEIAGEPLLCFSGENRASRHGEQIAAVFAAHELKVGSLRHVDGIESLFALIAGGQGISLLPRVLNTSRAKAIVARPLRESGDTLNFQLSAIWHSQAGSPAVQTFIEALRTVKLKLPRRAAAVGAND